MNSQATRFFSNTPRDDSHFQQVRLLHEEKGADWHSFSHTSLPRSWFELAQISSADRIEFLREFWLLRLPFHPHATKKIIAFFDRLDDIGVVLSRQSKEDPWTPHLVYSLADDSSFFQGRIPADETVLDEIDTFDVVFPRDFLAFLRIHNGFGRLAEFGLFPVQEFPLVRERLRNLLLSQEPPLRMGSSWLDPSSLLPFYEEYGVDSFQCFSAEWYPGSEMGNVYFSAIEGTLSDVSDRSSWKEERAFPTFIEWLTAFLGGTCF